MLRSILDELATRAPDLAKDAQLAAMRELLTALKSDYDHPWPNEDEATQFHRHKFLVSIHATLEQFTAGTELLAELTNLREFVGPEIRRSDFHTVGDMRKRIEELETRLKEERKEGKE